jgi:predicted transcriptional regulator
MFNLWPVPISAVLAYLAFINLILAAFNMIPAFPLDGGRVLRAILWKWKNDLEWSTRLTTRIGAGFGLLMVFFGIFSLFTGELMNAVWLVLLGLFLRYLARNAYENMVLQQSLKGESIRRFVHSDSHSVAPSETVQSLVDNYIFKYYQRVFPVVENSRLVGCVNIDAVRQLGDEELERHSVSEIARQCDDDNTVEADTEATKALTHMSRGKTRTLMVVDHDRFLGIVTMRDIISYLHLRTELHATG